MLDGRTAYSVAPGQLGPTWPTSNAQVVLRPLTLGGFRLIEPGFWGERQRLNGEATIPLGRRRLEEAGNFHNLRLAAGLVSGDYQGPLYQDSDVYKWLEAVAWELGRRASPDLAGCQKDITELVAAAQRPDGYVNSYFQVHPEVARFSDLAHGHELYCAGHLVQAAIAQKRSTGDEGLLEVAVRFADYLVDEFGPGRRTGVPGHPEIEMALVELYRLTGQERYLALARYFVDARGKGLLENIRFGPAYYQDRVPVRNATSPEGHAVRALYLAAGATDVALETNDGELLAALIAQWRDMVATKTYLTGGLGSRWEGEAFGEQYELPADRAYCETCAAIASVLWSWRLLLATGESRYADVIERTLFNALISGVSADGTAFLYVNPLQLRDGDDAMSSRSPGKGRQAWFGTACCPTNLMRFLACIDQYAWTSSPRGLQLHQYMAGRVSHACANGEISLEVQTNYPWEGDVHISVSATPISPWELSVRIPAWCRAAHVAYGGSDEQLDAGTDGYLRLRRTWQPGDRLTLSLDMPARRTVALRDIDSAHGCEALERGPLVYCLEQTDLQWCRFNQLRIAQGEVELAPHPRLPGVVALAVPAKEALGVRRWDWPYQEEVPHEEYGPSGVVLATPYFAWGSGPVGPMRVWIPKTKDPQE